MLQRSFTNLAKKMTSNNNNYNNTKIEKEAVEIQSIIKDAERFVSVFLLTVLQAILNEQVKAKQLKKDVGDYIYQAVKDQANRKGFLD